MQAMKQTLKKLIWGGAGVVCPLCGSGLRSFRSSGTHDPRFDDRGVVGAGKRTNDACPVCFGQSRTRLIQFYLEKSDVLKSADVSLLHFAPELGLAQWLQQSLGLSYTCADIAPSKYGWAPNMVSADIAKMPFPDGAFDIVIASHVMEHVPHDRVAMRETYRVLKEGGSAILQVPYTNDGRLTDEDSQLKDEGERIARFGQADHVRLYGLKDYVMRLEMTGFAVELFDPFAADAPIAGARHLNQQEKLVVAHKKTAA